MKDIDTETTVVWPSWCYSDNICKTLLKPNADIEKDSLGCEPEIVLLPAIIESSTSNRLLTVNTPPLPSGGRNKQKNLLLSQAINDKMLSERSFLLSGYNNNTIDIKKNCEQIKTPPPSLSSAQAALNVTPSTAAAAAYLYLEKVKTERMSPRVTAAQIDSLKDAIMESSATAAVAAAMVNNNNCTSMSNNNSSSINSCSSSHSNSNAILSQNQTSDELHSHSLPPSSLVQQQHPSSSLQMNSNHVKRERLSPNGTNGDLQSALSRSRSTTPSTFRGTSPQHSVHSSPSEAVVPMHNLSTNLLNSIQQVASSSGRHNSLHFTSGTMSNSRTGQPSDFSTRNYSDFMRSLAAKYNNTNPNDTSDSRRQTFFDATANNATKKTTNTTPKASYPAPSPSNSISKEITITTTSSLPPPPPLSSAPISPGESVLTHTQQSQMAAAAVATAAAANVASGGNVSPFMTSFLSSLPFAQGMFPPLIDMSSTQALITLARAAKETEIHNILHMTQNSKQAASNVSPSPSPSLNMALQQAAQFISPALIYSAQLQKKQQVSRQSSPRLKNIANSSSSSAIAANRKNTGEKRNASPLDLSSQPPASKRFKAESTSNQNSHNGPVDAAIKRRASTSTATATPSPPPVNEKSSSPAEPAPTESAITAAFTSMVGGTSTSATSSAYTVLSTRQCQAHSEEVNSWTVHDVCAFVGSIDICAEYVKHFRDQCIDGSGLPLLTEDHLVNSLGMKLGPALKLRSLLAKKLGGPCPCVACVAQTQQILALQTGAGISATIATSAVPDSGSGNSNLSKASTTPIVSASTTNTSGSNFNSHNSNSSANKNYSTTITATSNANAIATATTIDSIECGGISTAAGNSNCNIDVATFSPSAYSNCSNNYSRNGSSKGTTISNLDSNNTS